MTFEECYPELVKAKDQYDMTLEPFIKKLEKMKKYAWKRYMTRIIQINKNL
jgi:hypothetical protein